MKKNIIFNRKKEYLPPSISIQYVLMEDKITTTSAYIIPGPESGNIQETWTEDTDVQKDYLW